MDIVSPPSLDIEGIFLKIVEIVMDSLPIVGRSANTIYSVLVVISVPVCVMILIGIFYSVERLKTLRRKDEEIYDTVAIEPSYNEKEKGNPDLTKRWRTALEHVESENPNDWRQAIMECDIILDEILEKMGYRGESIGERLKRVEKADFQTLDQAWEAHKVRNIIAHEGADAYALSHVEAKRVIGLYRQVFEEFFYI